jgi:dTDP-4-amino-4,6-dideoxygalactose transaminase
MNVPYFDLKGQTQSIRAELDRAIATQLDNGWFCLGPAVEGFEKAFSAYTGAKYSLGFNSGTSALS